LEAFATARTADSVRALLDLTPEQAIRIDDGREERVHPAHLRVGDVILVRPGERVGADAVIVDGTSEVDQASITGEPMPVRRRPGEEIFAGTVNGTGALLARVHRPAGETVLARIVAQVEQASATKARTHLFIEKVEQRYSVSVVVATLALFIIPLVLGAALQPTLLRAMTFMIVASPCAVVLATMPPLLSAIALAGRHGVLVKSAVVMEKLAGVDTVAFDKTGTLTEGTPVVVAVRSFGTDEGDMVRLAAAAEHHSEHPLAAAVVAEAGRRRLPLPPVGDVTALPGLGVTATVAGRRVRVGSPALLDGLPQTAGCAEARAAVRAAESDGHTAVLVVLDDEPVSLLTLTDRKRPEAAKSVATLTALTGRTPLLLTGDNGGAATRLAGEVGIDMVHAGLLPGDKVARVRALQDAGYTVLSVGDGINDAPALASADVGIAMGRGGADLTLQTADAVLVRDDLTALPALLGLARRARRIVVANLVIAGTFIAVLVTWDIIGHLPLPLGVAGHEGSTVIVALNGLRLLRDDAAWRAPQVARPTVAGRGASRTAP
jgi:heavy metal translocating P-type ATPase